MTDRPVTGASGWRAKLGAYAIALGLRIIPHGRERRELLGVILAWTEGRFEFVDRPSPDLPQGEGR